MQTKFIKRQITSRVGEHQALAFHPNGDMIIGRERLELLRQVPEMSALDFEVLRQIRSDDEVQVVLFRSEAPGGSWRFAEELTDDECAELGYLLFQTHRELFRKAMAYGIVVSCYTDCGHREVAAFRDGIRQIVGELEEDMTGAEPDELALLKIDAWLLSNSVFVFSLPYEKVVTEILPEHLPTLQRRLPKMRELLRDLPRRYRSITTFDDW